MNLLKNEKIKNLTLLFVSLIFAYLLSEGVLYFLEKKKLEQLARQHHLELYKQLYMVSPDPEVCFEPRPNVDIIFLSSRGDYYTMHVITNSEGLREENEIPFEKPSNEKRIIGLGDSVVFGSSVDNTETFLRVMEKFLSDNKIRVKTINFGVGSSNPKLEYYYIKYKKIEKYQPNLLLLGFVLNDFDTSDIAFDPNLGNWYYPSKSSQKQTPALKIKHFLAKSRVVRLIAGLENQIIRKMFFREPGSQINSEQKEEVKYWFKKIKEYADSVGIKFAIVIIPQKDQLEFALKTSNPFFKAQKMVIENCQELGIACYDLAPDLVNYLKNENIPLEQLYWDNIHPWKKGHFLIGQLVADWIKKNKFLED